MFFQRMVNFKTPLARAENPNSVPFVFAVAGEKLRFLMPRACPAEFPAFRYAAAPKNSPFRLHVLADVGG
jgi:hypothetical protein